MTKKKMNKKTKIILSGAAVLAAGAIANLDGDNVVKAADETKIEKPSTESINKTENKWVVNAQENNKEKLNKEEYSKDTKKLAILEKQKASIEKYSNNHPYVQDESQEAIKNINDEIAKADKNQYKTLTEYEKKAIVSKATTDDVYRTTNLKDEDAIDKTYKDLVKKYPNELKGNEKLNYLNSEKTFANPDKEFIKEIIENKVINLKETFPGPGWNNDYYLYKDNLETAKSRFKNYDNMVKTIDDFSNNKINKKTIEVDRDNNEKKLQEAVKQADKKYKELIRDKVSPEVALYSYYARGNIKIKDEFLKYNVTEKTHTGGDDRKEMVPVFIRQYLSLQKERNANLIKAKNVDYHEMTLEKIKENEKKLNDKYGDPKLMPSVSILEDFYYNDIMKVQELKEKKDLYNEFLNAINKGSSPSEIKKFRDKINRTKEAKEDDLKVRYRIYNEKAPAVIEMEKKSNDLSKPGKMMRVLLERNVKHRILNESPAEIEKEKTIEVNRLKKDIASNNLIKNNLEKQFDEKDKQLQKLYQNKGTANELSRTISEMNKIKKSYNDTLIKLNNSIRQISRIDYNNGVKVTPIRDLKIEKKQTTSTSSKYTSTGVNTPKPPVSNSNVAKPLPTVNKTTNNVAKPTPTVNNVSKPIAKPVVNNNVKPTLTTNTTKPVAKPTVKPVENKVVNRVSKPEAITKDTSDLIALNLKHRSLKTHLAKGDFGSPHMKKAVENRLKELEKEISTKNNSQYSNLTDFEKRYLERQFVEKNSKEDFKKTVEFLVKDMKEEVNKNPLMVKWNERPHAYESILKKPISEITMADFDYITKNYEAVPGVYKNKVLRNYEHKYIGVYYHGMLAYSDYRVKNDLLKYVKDETKYNTVKSIEDDILKRKSEIEREMKTLIKDVNSYYDKAIRPYVSKDLQVDPNGSKHTFNKESYSYKNAKEHDKHLYNKLRNFYLTEENILDNSFTIHQLATINDLTDKYEFFKDNDEVRALKFNENNYKNYEKYSNDVLFKPTGVPPKENIQKILEKLDVVTGLQHELKTKEAFLSTIRKENNIKNIRSIKIYDPDENYVQQFYEAIDIMKQLPKYRSQLIDYHAKVEAHLHSHRNTLLTSNISDAEKTKYIESVKKDVDNLNTMKTKLENDYATKDKELLALYNNKANTDTINKKVLEINSVKKAYTGVINDMNNKNRTLSRFNESIIPVNSVNMTVRQNVSKPLPVINNTVKPTTVANNTVAKPVVSNVNKSTSTVNNSTTHKVRPLSRVKRSAVGTPNEVDKAVNEAVRKVFGKHQDKNVNHTDSATTVNNVITAKGEPLVQPALPEYKENNTTPAKKYVKLKREIINENKVSPEKNTDSTTKQETPVKSAKGKALVQPVLPEYKELTSTVSKEDNKPQNKVAALVNEKPEFPLEELEKLKKEQDALNKKETTESKQENKKDNLLDKKDELKDKLTEKKEDIKQESKDLLKGLKDESTPKGSDLFDNLASKSSSHNNEDTPKIEKKELPKTSSTNSSGLAGIGALGVGLGAVIATRKKKLNR